jgi:hypothetical protein
MSSTRGMRPSRHSTAHAINSASRPLRLSGQVIRMADGNQSSESAPCLAVGIRIGSADRCCDAESQKSHASGFNIPLRQRRGVRCRRANVLSMCIGNNHSPIMARRKRAGSARTDRIWSRIVRRMVVVLRAGRPVKWASFARHARQERKFAASLADRASVTQDDHIAIFTIFLAIRRKVPHMLPHTWFPEPSLTAVPRGVGCRC